MLRISEIMFKWRGYRNSCGKGLGWSLLYADYGLTSNAGHKMLNDSKIVGGFVYDARARNCFDDCIDI